MGAVARALAWVIDESKCKSKHDSKPKLIAKSQHKARNLNEPSRKPGGDHCQTQTFDHCANPDELPVTDHEPLDDPEEDPSKKPWDSDYSSTTLTSNTRRQHTQVLEACKLWFQLRALNICLQHKRISLHGGVSHAWDKKWCSIHSCEKYFVPGTTEELA